MAATSLSCPYCNTAITATDSLQPGQPIRCPRCHELLPSSNMPQSSAAGKSAGFVGVEGWTNQADSLERFAPQRWSNRSLARMIVLAMLVMAGIGFLFAWFTTEQRRKRDRSGSSTDASLQRIISIKPERLAALAYLPADMSVVGGVHVAELMADERSRELLLQLRANHSFRLEDLERAGLKLEAIDHIAVGLRLEPAFPPPGVLVIRTREAYDADKVRTALKARPVEPRTSRALSRIQLGENYPFVILWCVDDHTLVASFQARDLPATAASPSPESQGYASHFPALQKHLEGLEEGTPVWVVGATEKLQKTLEELPFLPVPAEYRKTLGLLSSFAGSMQTDGDISWRVALDCANPSAAKTLDAYLARQGFGDGKVPRWFGNGPGSERLASEWSKSLVRKSEAERVLLEARSSFASLRDLLSVQP